MKLNSLKGRPFGLKERTHEDALYKIVANEIERGEKDPIAWTRAIEGVEGDLTKLQSAYIKNRVQRLRDEIYILNTKGTVETNALKHKEVKSEKPNRAQRKNQRLLQKASIQNNKEQAGEVDDDGRLDIRPLVVGIIFIAVLIVII